MSKLTIDDCKEVVAALVEEFRVAHGSLKLSHPDDPKDKQTVPPKMGTGFMVLVVGDFVNDGIDNDVEVAQKAFAYTVAKKLGIDCSPSDFQQLARSGGKEV